MKPNNPVYRPGDLGKPFHFNDNVCVELLFGVPDEKRTGRLVQVRKSVGAFGSDVLILRLRDGSLASFENVLLRHANDKDFEDAFYYSNGKRPPIIPDQPCHEDDSPTAEYTIKNQWPETGFIIEHPSQPQSAKQSFGVMVITP